MQKVFFCKIGALALLCLAVAIAASPLQQTEDAITVPAIHFRSKSSDELCTGFQIKGNLFATLARCLGTERSEINKLRELDIVEQGIQKVQAFALQAEDADSIGDIAVLVYGAENNKGLEPVADRNGLFEKFGLVPRMRSERDAEDGAAFAEVNIRVMGAALVLLGSMLMK
ncbi:uncharacterized protein LOC131433006 [Malaya genurostris]|uniref:uncharacterized protein LOC131433006 n=1 Tax=Malaya genurostris TaxID=325434 RepID=UPI0026F3E361|nr:uncharacterized protein LOC131433006 [Malaya genurostris]